MGLLDCRGKGNPDGSMRQNAAECGRMLRPCFLVVKSGEGGSWGWTLADLG